MTDLCLRDALDLLKNEGHTNATATRVHHAIIAGHVSRPKLDGSHRYRFSRRNLNELRRYLKNVPPPGRRPGRSRQRRVAAAK